MSWRRKEPGHQQPWCWLCWTELIRFLYIKGWAWLVNLRPFDSLVPGDGIWRHETWSTLVHVMTYFLIVLGRCLQQFGPSLIRLCYTCICPYCIHLHTKYRSCPQPKNENNGFSLHKIRFSVNSFYCITTHLSKSLKSYFVYILTGLDISHCLTALGK